MSERIIIVSFGTRDSSAAETMERLERRLESLSPFSVSKAYLSSQEHSLEKAISSLGPDNARIMPILIQKGEEYDRILSYGFRTGSPLLGSEEDAAAISKILSTSLPEKSDTSYLLIAHGSEGRRIPEYDILNSFLRSDISLVTLKGPGNYHTAKLGEKENIIVVPFLLAFGRHAKNDIKKEAVPFLMEKGRNVRLEENGLLSFSEDFSLLFEKHFRTLLNS